MMKTIFAVVLSASLIGCVAEDADGLDTVELTDNTEVDLDEKDGNHVGPTAGIEQPDGPGVTTRDDEGPHLSIEGVTAEAETLGLDRNPFEGSYVGSTGLAEILEAARVRFDVTPTVAGRR